MNKRQKRFAKLYKKVSFIDSNIDWKTFKRIIKEIEQDGDLEIVEKNMTAKYNHHIKMFGMKKAVNVDTFIKKHNHVNYCECIIHRDGRVEYATPSHMEVLIKATGYTRREINKIMPITASPLDWLIDYSKCIAVYTTFVKKPKCKITLAQSISLNKLVNASLTKLG